MHISVFDIFKIGIGPSSSHTVGPMRAAARFARHLEGKAVARVTVELFGSLGFTGKGHGSDVAVLMGLEGEDPETIDIDSIPARVATATAAGKVEILFNRRESLPLHSNGMKFTALDAAGQPVVEKVYYSVGGGFLIGADGAPLAEGAA